VDGLHFSELCINDIDEFIDDFGCFFIVIEFQMANG
jgi:hypothetical protein